MVDSWSCFSGFKSKIVTDISRIQKEAQGANDKMDFQMVQTLKLRRYDLERLNEVRTLY